MTMTAAANDPDGQNWRGTRLMAGGLLWKARLAARVGCLPSDNPMLVP